MLIDLAKFFIEDIKDCLAISSFILNHDEVYGEFLLLGLPMVKQEVDTRFATTTIAVESVLLVWDDLPSFLMSKRIQTYLKRADTNYISSSILWTKVTAPVPNGMGVPMMMHSLTPQISSVRPRAAASKR